VKKNETVHQEKRKDELLRISREKQLAPQMRGGAGKENFAKLVGKRSEKKN